MPRRLNLETVGLPTWILEHRFNAYTIRTYSFFRSQPRRSFSSASPNQSYAGTIRLDTNAADRSNEDVHVEMLLSTSTSPIPRTRSYELNKLVQNPRTRLLLVNRQ